VKSRAFLVTLTAPILWACAEGDFGGSVLWSQKLNNGNSLDRKVLGAYYTDIDSSITISVSKQPGQQSPPKPASASLSVTHTAFGTNLHYLYVMKNPFFFSNTETFGTNINGMALSADTQSQQDLSGVLAKWPKRLLQLAEFWKLRRNRVAWKLSPLTPNSQRRPQHLSSIKRQTNPAPYKTKLANLPNF
jgi:hypothetical protein